MTNLDLSIKFFLQIAVIMFSSRVVSYLGYRYLRQTRVVCEMLTGVLLGPSFFGLIFPKIQAYIFPKAPLLLQDGTFFPNPSMSILFVCSQIGLMLYMFLTGLEFNTNIIKQRFKSSLCISFAGIFAPFLLVLIFMLLVPAISDLFQPGIHFYYKTFFLGICLSITAFPMMARILVENKIAKTKFGTIAMAAGSMDDIMAWILLAALLSVINGSLWTVSLATFGTFLYVILLLLFRRRVNNLILQDFKSKHVLTDKLFSSVLIILLLCALFTDKIGIYLVFGSFLAGIMLPRGAFAEQIKIRTLDIVNLMFLPTFFVFSGLNTQIGILNQEMWLIALGVFCIALFGKGIACLLAARWVGETWRESATIGSLMNARGLMELIAINIGLQANIITIELYTILVIMAVVTTLMASPLYYLFMRPKKRDIS